MKKLLLSILVSLFALPTVQAAEVGYKFNSLACAEWDPFVLGDRCLMTVYNGNEKLVLDLDFYSFLDLYDGEDEGQFLNKVILINSEDLEKLSKKEVREIRKYVPSSFSKAKVRKLDPSLFTLAQDDQD